MMVLARVCLFGWMACAPAAEPSAAVPLRAASAGPAIATAVESQASVEADPPRTPPLYGFWGLNGYVSSAGLADVESRLGLTVFQVASSNPSWTVRVLLPMVRRAGLKVTLRMTDDHWAYTTGGAFDLEKWKANLDRWRGADVASFIEDGTLTGHMILDDIHNFETVDPSAADLEAMAAHSDALFPGLMTFVRVQATTIPVPASGRYTLVDACVNQYESKEGPVEVYAATEAARAAELGLGIINGLNIADGGDGSSGQPGWRRGFHAMSADEIRRYGAVLADVPGLIMFLNWEYDAEEAWSDGTIGAEYFRDPAREAALRELGERVKASGG